MGEVSGSTSSDTKQDPYETECLDRLGARYACWTGGGSEAGTWRWLPDMAPQRVSRMGVAALAMLAILVRSPWCV
jgi:hypothetical protein